MVDGKLYEKKSTARVVNAIAFLLMTDEMHHRSLQHRRIVMHVYLNVFDMSIKVLVLVNSQLLQ